MLIHKHPYKNFLAATIFLGGLLFGFVIGIKLSYAVEEESYLELLESEKWTTYPDGWFYNLEEIKELYSKEYYQERRLVNFIRIKDGKYIAPCNGEYVEVPRRFIYSTIENIKNMLKNGSARYIFRLDSFHAHPFVTNDQFEKRYKNLNTFEMIAEYTKDDSLGVLFHNAEHLALRNPPITGAVDLEAWELIKRRNVIGWYDGRPLEIVDLGDVTVGSEKKSLTATIPKGHHNVGAITFKATNNGEFEMKVDGKTLRLDISLYECFYH